MTGSEFGFINEMDTDGLLHDVAKSELGWEQCLMYDKTGHRRPPSVFAVHGLYGSVINNEKSFFTNDPQSHPDSIGIPDGHQPITSFLGVPLVQDGKTIGVIAVANHEGGYSCEQQEDLEAIAPAVVQALKRKKEEHERKLAEEALSRERSLLESVMQATDVMLVLLDPQFNFLWVNSAYAETCQLKPEEMVGKNKDLYLAALKNTIPMFSETGKMDPKGADAVLSVFSVGSPEVANAKIDVSKTFTNKFVDQARKTTGLNAK